MIGLATDRILDVLGQDLGLDPMAGHGAHHRVQIELPGPYVGRDLLVVRE